MVIGKPEPTMYDAARDRLGPGRILGVGDRLEIDVLGARRAGLDQALVLTGGASRVEAEAADPCPDASSPTRSPRSCCQHKEGLSLFMFPAQSKELPAAAPAGASASMRARTSGERDTSAARRFSSRWDGVRVLGIGTMSSR